MCLISGLTLEVLSVIQYIRFYQQKVLEIYKIVTYNVGLDQEPALTRNLL